MYYEPGKSHHGLPHDPFKSSVVPRPIGWISTLSRAGVHNLAPFSQFQNLSFDPPYVMISSSQRIGGEEQKDTVANIERTGEFVWNMATYDLRHAVVTSAIAAPPDVDEFELAGLEKAPSRLVKPARVAASPIQFECVYFQTIKLPMGDAQSAVDVVIGRVVGVHIAEDAIRADGRIDILKIKPLARLGYHDYTTVESIFELKVPVADPRHLARQEGNAHVYATSVEAG
jgi:flavin reductase (DIM6/NTAB) family NADH-FMN oxidoreductase RutF